MLKNFELILTSYPDCDYFVVEIWFQNNLIAVLEENSEIQLFKDNAKQSVFESREFASAIKIAKEKLTPGC